MIFNVFFNLDLSFLNKYVIIIFFIEKCNEPEGIQDLKYQINSSITFLDTCWDFIV